MSTQIIKKDEIEKITINNIIDGLTGFITSGKTDYAHTANRLFKSLFAHNFLNQLQMEWDSYCVKGTVDLDYSSTKPYINSLSELLDYLDSDIPNDEIADTLKKLFFIPSFRDLLNEDDKLLSIEYMKLVKQLNSGELTVLFTTYKYNNLNIHNTRSSWDAEKWLNEIAVKSNLKYSELVEVHEKKLMELCLITKRKYEDESGIILNNKFRLTNLGYNLCKYIELYNNFKQD